MITTSDPVAAQAPAPAQLRETRPFVWLRPARPGGLRASEILGLDALRDAADGSHSMLVRALVDHSLRAGRGLDLVTRRAAPTTSMLNRRRRAARLWINAILAGNCDESELRSLTTAWLPQLAGTGPEPRRAARAGRHFVEFLRGSITAVIFGAVADNLVPHARALHALDGVLAVQLRAIDAAAES